MHGQKTLVKVLIAKVEILTINGNSKIFSEVTKKKTEQLREGTMGNHKTILVSSIQDGARPVEIEAKIKQSLRPKYLNVGNRTLTRTKKGVAITTKNESANNLIKTATGENEQMKELSSKTSINDTQSGTLQCFQQETEESELTEGLAKKNSIKGDRCMILCQMKRSNANYWVIETDPESFQKLERKKNICIV